MDVEEQPEASLASVPRMRLHVHEWGDPAAPAVVCVHGVSAHGRRYRRLAEERLAARFHVLAPDLRGHGSSEREPPWNLETHLEDLLETFEAEGPAMWVGHSFGGRLVLELAARRPELLTCAVLLDPAIQILPHVGFDFAQEAAKDHAFASPDEAIEARLTSGFATPRPALEEEAREHLDPVAGRPPALALRARRGRDDVQRASPEPPPRRARRLPTLLVHAEQFGLVRDDQLEEYPATLGESLELSPCPAAMSSTGTPSS